MPVANKHLEKADRLLQKGKLPAALAEFLLAWKEEPANDAIVYTVAELYQRLGKTKESRECYLFLYEKALERTDGQKVAELLRKMQMLGPVEPARLIAAAQLLEKQKPELAVEQYRRVMEIAGEQQPEIVLQCLQGLVRMQPGSLDLNRRVAAAATRAGNITAAIAAYRKLADLLIPIGKWKEGAEALEEICRLSPQDRAARLALARVYLKAGDPAKLLALWEEPPAPEEDREVAALLAQAYLAEGKLEKAEGLYWQVLEGSSQAAAALLEIAKGYLAADNHRALVGLLRSLEEHIGSYQLQRELIGLAEGLVKLEHKDTAVLDRLAIVLDRLHLDAPLASVLDTLFNLHFAAREFRKAGEALERVITVDPYNPLSTEKLERLEGKLDASVLRELGNRLGGNVSGGDSAATAAVGSSELGGMAQGPDSGSSPLKDLMLQAEIFLQYGMKDKARERLERVGKLFPGEEQHNEELRGLLERAGFAPVTPDPAQAPAAPAEGRDFRADLKKVSEISRNLSRQGTVKSVLFAAVNDIGRFWQVSRCVAGLATPNRPPSMALEYISPGMPPSEPAKLGKLVMGLQQALAGKNFPLVAENVSQSPTLAGLQDTLSALQVKSLVAIPLRDAEQEMGILLLEQCGEQRKWKGNDLAGLEALAEQIVMAVANVRLRNLMKALAVTDERSGLLHRESYLTCLLSEAERMRTQKTPLSAALLEFSRKEAPSASAAPLPKKEKGKGAGDLVEKFCPTVTSHLRQNDMAVRYNVSTLALILPGAVGKDAAGVTDKMRKLILSAAMQTDQEPPLVTIGVAEAIRDGGMDSTDRITELINRLEWALDAARQSGSDAVKLLEPPALPQ